MQFTTAIIALVTSMAATVTATPFPQGGYVPPTCPSNGQYTAEDGSVWSLRDRTDWGPGELNIQVANIVGITYGRVSSRVDCIKAAVKWNKQNSEKAIAIVYNTSQEKERTQWSALCWLKKSLGPTPCGTTHPHGSSAMVIKACSS